MNKFTETLLGQTRRQFLGSTLAGLGAVALRTLAGTPSTVTSARAKRVIFLHMAGGPSQLELFDWKPELAARHGQPCPASLLEGKRFAFIRGQPTLLGPQAAFTQHGESGAWVSERLPEFSQVVDDVTFIKTLQTDQFNHAPAQLLVQTGGAEHGRPSFGSWATYGLGSANANLPAFMVLLSGGKAPDAGAGIWASGFLPAVYQGVQCQNVGSPIHFAEDPAETSRTLRRVTLDAVADLNRARHAEYADPETLHRIEQYELAFRMQTAVPEVMDLTQEDARTLAEYGATPGVASFANNCLLARRLAEQGVRFIQLYDWGWDSHGSTPHESLQEGFMHKCRTVDRPMTALLRDLKQRGLLEDTLVVWAGEFGRTPMMENRGGQANPYQGRDHHPHAFTVWMAGGGMRAAYTHGETDPFGCMPVRDAMHVHDLQATILHSLGLDHTQLTFRHQGRDFRLTDVHGRVVQALLA